MLDLRYYTLHSRSEIYFPSVGILTIKSNFVEFSNCRKCWFIPHKTHFLLHRTDGPASYLDDKHPAYRLWCLNGLEYTLNNWLELTTLSTEEKVELKFLYS